MWLDVTVAIDDNNIPIWPGCPSVTKEITQSSDSVSSNIHFNLHTGTHIDAPFHVIQNGAKTDKFPMKYIYSRKVLVSEWNKWKSISLLHAVCIDYPTKIVFFKTGNYMKGTFNPNYTYIEPDAAKYIASRGDIKIIGIDTVSVENFHSTEKKTHNILLGNGVWIIEGLDLTKVEPGHYDVIIAPMKITAEATPVRVLINLATRQN